MLYGFFCIFLWEMRFKELVKENCDVLNNVVIMNNKVYCFLFKYFRFLRSYDLW